MIRAEEIKGSLDRSSDTMTLHGIKQWISFFPVAANKIPSA